MNRATNAMKILAIDTSTDACSVALFIDQSVFGRFEVAPRRHTELVLPMAESVLDEGDLKVTDLDAVAFARGPGAFTGLRIAAGVAQGIALGADIPVIPVSTLATLAQALFDQGRVHAAACALDARMGEVYWGAYRSDADGVAQAVVPEVVCEAGEVDVLEGGGWVGVGSGWGTYGHELAARFANGAPAEVLPEMMPDAAAMYRLVERAWRQGDLLPAEQAQPIYLRDNVAKKPGGVSA